MLHGHGYDTTLWDVRRHLFWCHSVFWSVPSVSYSCLTRHGPDFFLEWLWFLSHSGLWRLGGLNCSGIRGSRSWDKWSPFPVIVTHSKFSESVHYSLLSSILNNECFHFHGLRKFSLYISIFLTSTIIPKLQAWRPIQRISHPSIYTYWEFYW